MDQRAGSHSLGQRRIGFENRRRGPEWLPGATIFLPDDVLAVGYRMHETQRFSHAGIFNNSQLRQEA
jgi:hypothetical protein